MCLAVPGKVISIDEELMAEVDYGYVINKVSLKLSPKASCGQWVLVHAGFAVQILDEEEAMETLALLRELAEYA